jgi:hypothetical protein
VVREEQLEVDELGSDAMGSDAMGSSDCSPFDNVFDTILTRGVLFPLVIARGAGLLFG